MSKPREFAVQIYVAGLAGPVAQWRFLEASSQAKANDAARRIAAGMDGSRVRQVLDPIKFPEYCARVKALASQGAAP